MQRLRALQPVLILCAVFALPSAAGAAVKYSLVYSFADGAQGSEPVANVIFDKAGNVYGVTNWPYGAVFELARGTGGNWTETPLHIFTGGSEGYSPWGGLVFDTSGNLYGTTVSGDGSGCGGDGCGTVFELSPNGGGSGWTETILHKFTGGSDGYGPEASLTFDAAGNLYGTTTWGGDASCNRGVGCGTVFELSPGAKGVWSENLLYVFPGGHGNAYPFFSGVIFDTAGNLYGTTAGSTNGTWEGYGTVFELVNMGNGNWKHQILYHFPGTNGLGYPAAGLVFDREGNLCGTAQGDPHAKDCCGAVFELEHANGDWSELTLHQFEGSDGEFPLAGVVFGRSGDLVGVTPEGGQGNCFAACGVLFELSPSQGGWTETVLHTFGGQGDGTFPISGLTRDGNTFAGTTQWGGPSAYGTVYEIKP